MVKVMINQLGSWSFFVGVILAITLGFREINNTIAIVLVLIGLTIGMINITDKEIKPFLHSGVIIVIVSSLGQTATEQIAWLSHILGAIMLIFVPATIIVALKSVFHMAST